VTQAAAQSDLLDPQVVNRLGRLEVIASRVVEGYLAGKHRSPYKGGCIEFAEHRHYTPGDELRLIDWRAYGRSDRYYIKQYQEETNMQVMLLLDASGSMRFGMSTVSKFRYVQMAAACLSRLMLQQSDAVGLAMIDATVRGIIPPRSRANHLRVILDTLERGDTGGETSLAGNIQRLAQRFPRRGMVILMSDCFDNIDALLIALRHLRMRGHDVVLLHVMAPEELDFTFTRFSRFDCLEVDGRRVRVDPLAVRKHYLSSVERFLDRLRRGCGEIGCDYVPLRTDQPLGEALAIYLGRRAARFRRS
jgi:uncharacterized protein (DUF58 family)